MKWSMMLQGGLVVGGLGLLGCDARCGDGAVGSGDFCYSEQAPLSTSVRELVIEDLDQNGFVDIALILFDENPRLEILLNEEGSLTRRELPLSTTPTALAAGDMDADGDIDLILGQGDSDPDTFTGGVISVLGNDGAASFTTLTTFQTAGLPSALATADLDGDLDRDILLGSQGFLFEGSVESFLQDAGSFTLFSSQPVGAIPTEVTLSDFDRDGDTDVQTDIVGLLVLSTLRLDNLGNGRFDTPEELVPNEFLGDSILPVSGDLDGDGVADNVTAREDFDLFSEFPIEIKAELSSGKKESIVLQRTWQNDSFLEDISLSDLDADGDLDVLVILEVSTPTDETLGRLFLVENKGEGRLGNKEEISLSLAPSRVFTADLRNDGQPSLLLLDDEGTLHFFGSAL